MATWHVALPAMSRSFLFALGTLSPGADAGCAYLGPPVPVYGEGAALAALAGVWEGTYESEDDGQTGTLSSQPAADADSAYGEVVMLAEPAGRRPQPGDDARGRPPVLVPRAERPRIEFVRVDRGVVAGTLTRTPAPSARA